MQALPENMLQKVAVVPRTIGMNKANQGMTWQGKSICFCDSITLFRGPCSSTSCRYDGYNKDLIDRFCSMGFDVERVVDAFKYVGVDRLGGEEYELDEGQMGDITARLLGEP